MIEEFTWKALDLLSKLDRLREMLTSPELPDDLNTAKLMIEQHNRLRKKVVKAPIDALEAEGQRILQRICGGTGRHCRNTGNAGMRSSITDGIMTCVYFFIIRKQLINMS